MYDKLGGIFSRVTLAFMKDVCWAMFCYEVSVVAGMFLPFADLFFILLGLVIDELLILLCDRFDESPLREVGKIHVCLFPRKERNTRMDYFYSTVKGLAGRLVNKQRKYNVNTALLCKGVTLLLLMFLWFAVHEVMSYFWEAPSMSHVGWMITCILEGYLCGIC